MESLNYLVALGAVGMQVLAVFLFALFFVRRDFPLISKAIGKWGTWISFLIVLVSIGVSLYYSDYLGVIPCSLCWFQRIFLYPQIVLFGVALWKKESARIADYSIALSICGGVIALYQDYIQMVGESPLPCPASGGDCLQRFLFEFGYVTFPLVAFSAFALLITIMLFVRKQNVS